MSAEELDTFVNTVTHVIQATIEKHVPKSWLSPFSKCWWTPELTRLRCAYAKCSHTEFQACGTSGWAGTKESCAAAHNKYNSTLCHTKAMHWKEWLEEITEQDIWRAARIAPNPLSDGSRMCIPMLYTRTASNEVITTHGTVEQKAIAVRRAPGTQQLALCLQANRCRTLFQPTCIRWWQVDLKSNTPSRVGSAWSAATARLDNAVPPCSLPASRPGARVRHRNRVK